MLEITETDMKQIKDDLRKEYPDEEVDDMLRDADIRKTEEGITVTYDNGNQDVYAYTRVLVHSSDMVKSPEDDLACTGEQAIAFAREQAPNRDPVPIYDGPVTVLDI